MIWGVGFLRQARENPSTYVGGDGEAPMFLFELNRPSLRVVSVGTTVGFFEFCYKEMPGGGSGRLRCSRSKIDKEILLLPKGNKV